MKANRSSPRLVPPAKMQNEVLQIPEWEPLGLQLDHAALRRHVMAMGETGSGKTASVILPLINAMLVPATAGSECGVQPSALVIDPKDEELTTFLAARVDPERLKVIAPGRRNWVIPFFTPHPSEKLPTAQEMCDALLSANPSDPAGHTKNAGFWIATGRRLIEGFMAADHWLARTSGPDSVLVAWEELFRFTTGQEAPSRAGQPLSSANRLGPRDLWHRGGYVDLLAWAVSRTVSDASFLGTWRNMQEDRGCPRILWDATASLAHSAPETLGGIALTAQNFLDPFTLPATGGHLWTNPFSNPTRNLSIEPTALMDQGSIVVYCPPDPSRKSNILGQALKRNFFRSALNTRDRSRPFFYIADEFQRFITADAVSGEATFFDRCRSYGISCLVATQSESSLRQALWASGQGEQGEAALQVMLANLATQFYFRTTDLKTQERLRALIPGHPDDPTLPHVVDLRPVTSLRPGEAYWMAATGAWGRGRAKLQTCDVDEAQ